MTKEDGTQHKLAEATEEKDLGIIIDSNLTFNNHINQKVNKANSMMGLIRRSFIFLNENTFKTLYRAIVRPHLEYGNDVWSPNLKKDVTIQRTPTKTKATNTEIHTTKG